MIGEACGPAGAKATLASYRDAGYDAIPSRGPLAALTVPGAVGGFALAHELARGMGGRIAACPISWRMPAARPARASPSRPRWRGNEPSEFEELCAAPGFAASFLTDGKLPKLAGAKLKQAALAGMIEHLGRAGFDDFYRGDVGREIAADLASRSAAPSRARTSRAIAPSSAPRSASRFRARISTTRRRRHRASPR